MDISAILDYVSPRELERFENADFRQLTEADEAAKLAEQQEMERTARILNSRPRPGQSVIRAPGVALRGRPPGRGRGSGRGRGRPPKSALAHVVEPLDEEEDAMDVGPPPGFTRVPVESDGDEPMGPEPLQQAEQDTTEEESLAPPPGFIRSSPPGGDTEESEDESIDGRSSPPPGFRRAEVVEQEEEDRDEKNGGPSRPPPGLHRAPSGKERGDVDEATKPPPGFNRVFTIADSEDDDESEDELQKPQPPTRSTHPSSLNMHPIISVSPKQKSIPVKPSQRTELSESPPPDFNHLSASEKLAAISKSAQSKGPSPEKRRKRGRHSKPKASPISSKKQHPSPSFKRSSFVTNSALTTSTPKSKRPILLIDEFPDQESIIPDSEDEVQIVGDRDHTVHSSRDEDQLEVNPQVYRHLIHDANTGTKKGSGRRSRPRSKSPVHDVVSSNGAVHRHKRRRTETASPSRQLVEESRSRSYSYRSIEPVMHDTINVAPKPSTTNDDDHEIEDDEEEKGDEEEEEVYVVENILSHQVLNGETWYLVKWEGVEEAEDWVEEGHLEGAGEVVREYKERLRREKGG